MKEELQIDFKEMLEDMKASNPAMHDMITRKVIAEDIDVATGQTLDFEVVKRVEA